MIRNWHKSLKRERRRKRRQSASVPKQQLPAQLREVISYRGQGQTGVSAMERARTTARSLWLISLLLNFEGDTDTVAVLKLRPHQTSSVLSVEGSAIISKTARTGKYTRAQG
jgi:hypothetical protein